LHVLDVFMQKSEFFWLHIKKCGGGSVRQALAPAYHLAERVRQPVNFIQSPAPLWNDILNNFRVPLGAYQFRRALFAKRYLYPEPDQWNGMLRFAFTRDPIERAVSAFFYLSEARGYNLGFPQVLAAQGKIVPDALENRFDLFLDIVEQSLNSATFDGPINLHFSTHVAPIWGDVTDENGTILLSHMFRLNDFQAAIGWVRAQHGLPPLPGDEVPLKNQRSSKIKYSPSLAQRNRIMSLYPKDFDLFETSLTAPRL
jgi:hypothetical protein